MSISDVWIAVDSVNKIPNGNWLLRAEECGHPCILVVKVSDSPRPGRKVIWHGAGGSEQYDPKWLGYKFTHYAPFSAFVEVCQEVVW